MYRRAAPSPLLVFGVVGIAMAGIAMPSIAMAGTPKAPAEKTQTAPSSTDSRSSTPEGAQTNPPRPSPSPSDEARPSSEDGQEAPVVDATPQGVTAVEINEEIEVRGRSASLVGIAGMASEGITSRAQLETRPILRPGDLVETTPGVVATQHSGGGKANQFFLRGFNLDHGTDFRASVAGVPVNMPSHGHGQGYADLNFLIPEIVSTVRFRKGPFFAENGDFSAAGSIDIELADRLPESLVEVSLGSDDYGRMLWAESLEAGTGVLSAAIEIFRENGPWTRQEDYDGFKAFARYSRGDDARGLRLTYLGYDATWLSTDQVPRRAVESGLIGRFDLLDPGPRGSTERHSLVLETRRSAGHSLTRWRAYVSTYDFDLVSNFTYFLDNPVDGDQFEQVDHRWTGGGELRHHWHGNLGGRAVENIAGFQVRYDDIENGLFRTRDLARFDTVREDDIRQLGLGPFLESQVQWAPKARLRVGLRADYARVEVDSDARANSGDTDDLIWSPNLSLIFGPWEDTEIYLGYGRGFHSNDARGATLQVDPASGTGAEAVDLLVQAEGVDLGLRTSPVENWRMTLTVFRLELDSELVFVGDGGATESSRPSRRQGVEWTNYWQVDEHWTLDLDVTYTDAELTDIDPAGQAIPGAVEHTVAAGVVYDHEPWFASLRWRYFGDVPLIEDGSQVWESSSVANARFGYHFAFGLDLSLEIFNLFGSRDSDIEYFYASRLPGEPSSGIEDVHFHPMPERSARLIASWRY